MSREYPVARIGQKVAPFVLSAYNPVSGGFVEVSSESILSAGKYLVLIFYPADFTFVCPTELADVASRHKELQKTGAEVISVSSDTKFVHLAWHNTERLLTNVKYLMGADPIGKLARYFDIYDESAGTAYRGTFIINPDGILVGTEVNFYNVGRNAAELLRKMQANAYLRQHPKEACPANWSEGGKTLTPSEDMVGNVYAALNEGNV